MVCITFQLTFLVNLAFALALQKNQKTNAPLRVGILDLDIFGPSIPTLMGLIGVGEPALTKSVSFHHALLKELTSI